MVLSGQEWRVSAALTRVVGVEFNLLGPFEVLVQGERRVLGSPAEKAVLALLLLASGRVVSREVLVDALWGEVPPTNPANAVQGRISRLRRALADIGLPASLVAADGPGYVLAGDPAAVDVHRFAVLLRPARAERDDSTGAARLYREALGLWRGPALADFTGEMWAAPEVARLEEQRLAAVEERIALDLDAGRHTDVLEELEVLTASNPLRERLYGQLMLALYRSGRQADALAVYRRLHQMLDEELGLDPSEELRELEQAILRQDGRLRAPAQELPHQLGNLPVRITSFVGRERELGQLTRLLEEHRLVTLTGPGGAGKTSLALQIASMVADQYADGVRLIRLAGVDDPSALPDIVAESVGAQRPAGTVSESLLGYLRDRSTLLVLDNCEHLVQACAELVERLLTSSSTLRLLTTSREPLRVPGEVQVAVAPLPVPPTGAGPDQAREYAAVQLFLQRAEAVDPDLDVDEDSLADIAEICRQLDGLPLALELAAARLTTLSIGDLAARLDDRFRLLTGGARTAEGRQKTLQAAVDWSYQLLTPPEQRLFRRLSVFRGGWTLAAAEAVTSDDTLPAAEVLDLLGGLVSRSLIQADRRAHLSRFRMLETLRQYAGERADAANEGDQLSSAHAEYFTALAEAGGEALRGPGQARWLQQLRDERRNIDAALLWARRRTDIDPDLGLRLVAAMGWFWYFTSNQDAAKVIDVMLRHPAGGSARARALAIQARSIVARPGSCIVHPSPGCAQDARDSLQSLDRLGERHRAAYSATLLAVEGVAAPPSAASDELLTTARDAFHQANDRWGHALTLFVEMELLFAARNLEQGRAVFHAALEQFRDLGDHWGISAVQYHYALALHRGGLPTEAMQAYRSALAEGRIGLTNTVQYAVANLGHLSLMIGDLDAAAAYFSSAHTVARDLGADISVLAAIGQGHLARLRGDTCEAADRYQTALNWIKEADTPDWAATALTGLGHIALEQGDPDAAHSHYAHALQLVTVDNEPRYPAAAAALEGLARLSASRGLERTTRALLRRAAHYRRTQAVPPTPLERQDLETAHQFFPDTETPAAHPSV